MPCINRNDLPQDWFPGSTSDVCKNRQSGNCACLTLPNGAVLSRFAFLCSLWAFWSFLHTFWVHVISLINQATFSAGYYEGVISFLSCLFLKKLRSHNRLKWRLKRKRKHKAVTIIPETYLIWWNKCSNCFE